VAHRSPFCRSQTEFGIKQPCLAQQQATTPVTSRFRRLLELAAFTARWFRHEGLYCERSVYYQGQTCQSTHKNGFFNEAQIFLVPALLHHKSSTVCQPNIQIWPTHLDMIGMEISIHGDGSSSHPIGELSPVCREIYPGLGTRGAENRKASRRGRRVLVDCSKPFQVL
jgi:hypothetical protein